MPCVVQYFNINRILLLIIGLWPYQRSTFTHLQVILFFGILISAIIFQIIIFISIECTADNILHILSSVIYSVTNMIIYNSFWINIHAVKYLLEQLQCICNELKDKNEITIIKQYGNKTKYQTIILLSIILSGSLIFIPLTIWPRIIDIDIVFLNGSQSCRTRQTIITEYLLDQEIYFYLNLLYIYVTYFIGGFTLTTVASIIMGYIKYICGMFKIASYRIEQAFMLENMRPKKNISIDKNIICGIDIHCKAMTFSKFLASTFQGMFLALIFVAVICLSLNLFAIFHCVFVGDNVGKCLLHSAIIFIILLYTFLTNYAGQEIIDHNNDVFSAAYNIQWYVAPLHTQKMILFLLQRGNTAFNINIAGIFTGSLECFATMMKQSISYFTVIYSTQQ